MRILPLLLAFVFCAQGALAQDEDWTVGTVLKDGTKVLYEVIPTTADIFIQPELVLYTTVVEVTTITTNEMTRKRLFATGCESGTGKVTFSNMDGTKTPGAVIFEWDKDGDKVFDALAVRVCIAYSQKVKKKQQGGNTKGPLI